VTRTTRSRLISTGGSDSKTITSKDAVKPNGRWQYDSPCRGRVDGRYRPSILEAYYSYHGGKEAPIIEDTL